MSDPSKPNQKRERGRTHAFEEDEEFWEQTVNTEDVTNFLRKKQDKVKSLQIREGRRRKHKERNAA